MTGDEYTGKHRRTGPAGAPGGAGPGRRPGAGRLLPAQVVVIAKEPIPGRVKTRLTPPFTPEEAAALAGAALGDTLAAVASTAVARRVVALDGMPGPWLPAGFDMIAQRGAGLDERIAWALSDARVTLPLPVVLIGMDTPQVTPGLLAAAAEPLVSRTADATFGLAEDGGFWLLGLREVDPGLILGVPMSRPDTGARQLARLERAGLRVRMLPELTDVDTVSEAEHIAAVTPGSRFAACMSRVRDRAPRVVAAALLPRSPAAGDYGAARGRGPRFTRCDMSRNQPRGRPGKAPPHGVISGRSGHRARAAQATGPVTVTRLP